VFFKQFYNQGLGHASYLIGSEQTGEAFVFDPRRDVEAYFDAARMQGLRIRHALDSHGHNDYLSGLTEIAGRTEVELWGSAEADLGYGHRPLRDGEQLELGEVGIEVMHTPGQTPEHLSLLNYDRDASSGEPALLLSGGALLVGDLARPDLLGGRDQAEEAARVFCQTIQKKLLELPDHLEVFPTHVAGSLCGGNIGSRLSTTVGYERRTNAILAKVSSKGGVRRAVPAPGQPPRRPSVLEAHAPPEPGRRCGARNSARASRSQARGLRADRGRRRRRARHPLPRSLRRRPYTRCSQCRTGRSLRHLGRHRGR